MRFTDEDLIKWAATGGWPDDRIGEASCDAVYRLVGETLWQCAMASPALAEAVLKERKENLRFREALQQIDDLCPATCDMTIAHSMAAIALEALMKDTL